MSFLLIFLQLLLIIFVPGPVSSTIKLIVTQWQKGAIYCIYVGYIVIKDIAGVMHWETRTDMSVYLTWKYTRKAFSTSPISVKLWSVESLSITDTSWKNLWYYAWHEVFSKDFLILPKLAWTFKKLKVHDARIYLRFMNNYERWGKNSLLSYILAILQMSTGKRKSIFSWSWPMRICLGCRFPHNALCCNPPDTI